MINNSNFEGFPYIRSRRLRNSNWIRNITAETEISKNDLVQPIFIKSEGNDDFIRKMPGIKRYTPKGLKPEIESLIKLGVKAIAIFPQISQRLKTHDALEAVNPNNLVCNILRFLRKEFPELGVICDVALDPYTLSGHDGLLNKSGKIDNDRTIKLLSKMAINFASAGCEMIAPSDMMDGRVKIIRKDLEKNNFHNVSILAYSAKFCSNFYGPFRSAIGNEENLGNSSKESYQLNYKNRLEAMKDAELDIFEGADILMIKPAGYYLDIIREISNYTYLPISAYQVSGEYSMIKLASENNIFDYEKIVLESLNCIKRAGANIIFSYFTKDVSRWI
mgnify:CR=1 FL=1